MADRMHQVIPSASKQRHRAAFERDSHRRIRHSCPTHQGTPLSLTAGKICKIEKENTAASGSASIQPFLRWSGGKRRSLGKLLDLSPKKFNAYHEPFVGGGCMFFALSAQSAYLSDQNIEVVRTYQAIKKSPRQVAELLSGIPHSESAFLKLRQLEPSECTDNEAAARLIFLMKSCFNGVYRENRAGRFNTPWGGKVYKLPDLSTLLNVQKRLAIATIENNDFGQVVGRACTGDFAYLDPPYPQKRYRGEFGSLFSEADVLRLSDTCHELSRNGVQVMVSYVVEPQLARTLKGWRVIEISPIRSVASSSSFRGRSRELVYMNY